MKERNAVPPKQVTLQCTLSFQQAIVLYFGGSKSLNRVQHPCVQEAEQLNQGVVYLSPDCRGLVAIMLMKQTQDCQRDCPVIQTRYHQSEQGNKQVQTITRSPYTGFICFGSATYLLMKCGAIDSIPTDVTCPPVQYRKMASLYREQVQFPSV